jgi:transposase
MIADICDVVIGVDTHKDTHTFAVLGSKTGEVLAVFHAAATAAGYADALCRLEMVVPGRVRLWAIEGTASYGAGLTRHLQRHEEMVAEVDHPHKRHRTVRGKSDEIDAIGAARAVMERQVLSEPRASGDRECLRLFMVARCGAVETLTDGMRRLRSLIVTAPSPLREKLCVSGRERLLAAVMALRSSRKDDSVIHTTILALKVIARRVQAAATDAKTLKEEISQRVRLICPALLAETGVGPISAAQVLISWSHPGRIRSEAAFARLAGIAPIPASSGMRHRHRLDRRGDRKLNNAIFTIALSRMRVDEKTRTYIKKRIAMGNSRKEAIRILKRHIIRGIFRIVENTATPKA